MNVAQDYENQLNQEVNSEKAAKAREKVQQFEQKVSGFSTLTLTTHTFLMCTWPCGSVSGICIRDFFDLPCSLLFQQLISRASCRTSAHVPGHPEALVSRYCDQTYVVPAEDVRTYAIFFVQLEGKRSYIQRLEEEFSARRAEYE